MTRVPRVIALAVAALAAPAVLIGASVPAASAAVVPSPTVLNVMFTGSGPTEPAAYTSAWNKMQAAHCSYEEQVSALQSGSLWYVTLEGSCVVG
jgi:hypothetical protein